MSTVDTIVGIIIIGAFFIIIGSKVYEHEKEHLDPVIKKIKGWFIKDEESGESFDPTMDYDLSFKGQIQ